MGIIKVKSKNIMDDLLVASLDELTELEKSKLYTFILELKSGGISSIIVSSSKEEIIKEFMDTGLVNKEKNTIKAYKSIMHDLLDGIYPDATFENLIHYLKRKDTIWSPNTKYRNYILIKNILNFMYRKKYILKDLSQELKIPKRIKTFQFVPNDSHIKAFFETLIRIYKRNEDRLLYETIFKIYCKTGFRLTELINLDYEDLDFNSMKIILTKTKNKNVDGFPIDDDLTEILLRYIKKNNMNNGPLIRGRHGARIYKNTITANFKKIRDSANLPASFTIHAFRRYFMDKLRREGVDIFKIKELARHADINTTYNYCRVVDSELREAVSKIKLDSL